MVKMCDHHFPFGHGGAYLTLTTQLASLGRFFVAHELRLIAAYLPFNYDFKTLDKLPRRRWIGPGMIQPFGARVDCGRLSCQGGTATRRTRTPARCYPRRLQNRDDPRL
ncbi:hypothetical protein ACRE_051810 [Hapsidospora chrysogenum ATCC 11550]|uniref:Uncharacterized protein n=1 Tax=Hapsidospora chrysogenum (strain ATCC 11550 / CBS 779.69 / DSM 880 / IAM 14645 / JCM 23072 / IMI 49137) TaxID=857340 RepID=A0A086T3T9_HAPC1|nr:hypothetical protein ACRE_051810 [Hapsidospora chrysogenum ATCC 11550]